MDIGHLVPLIHLPGKFGGSPVWWEGWGGGIRGQGNKDGGQGNKDGDRGNKGDLGNKGGGALGPIGPGKF